LSWVVATRFACRPPNAGAETRETRQRFPVDSPATCCVPGMAGILKGALSLPFMEKFRNSQSQLNILGK